MVGQNCVKYKLASGLVVSMLGTEKGPNHPINHFPKAVVNLLILQYLLLWGRSAEILRAQKRGVVLEYSFPVIRVHHLPFFTRANTLAKFGES